MTIPPVYLQDLQLLDYRRVDEETNKYCCYELGLSWSRKICGCTTRLKGAVPLLAIIALLTEKCFLTGDRAVCDRGAVILASKNQNLTVTRILPVTMPDQNKRINTERDLYQDQNGNTHTRVTRNTETVRNNLPDEYRDGYTHGRIAEASDNGKATRGLLLGLILTSVLGIAGGLLYYLSQRDSEPTTVPVTVPVPSPTATLSPTPTPERTIIERERTIQTSPTFVPIPQTPATTSPTPEPTINIQQSPTASPSPLNVNPEVNITIPPSPTPTPETPSGQTAPTPTTSPDTNPVPGVSGSQSQSQTPTPSPIPTLEAPSLQTAPTAPANQTDVAPAPQASPDATGSSPSPGAANP